MSGPLAGVRVLEISTAMAGPFAGMVLGDLGADVVKVERVGFGDDSRHWPPFFQNGMSHYYASANRNKRSIAVDFKKEAGATLLRRLMSEVDVVVENYRVGALDRAGLGYADVAPANPGLVYCSISGFGREGSYRGVAVNDLAMQAFAGGMSITGYPDGAPARMGISIGDLGAAMFAVTGVLAGLHHRDRTGLGQHVTTSLLEGQLALLSYHLMSFFATGEVPGRHGSGTNLGMPYQAFPTADEWLVIAVFNDSMWSACADVLGHPEWATDPRFQRVPDRVANRPLLESLIVEALRERTASEWERDLAAAGVPANRVNRIDEVLASPPVVEQDLMVSIEVDGGLSVPMPAVPVGFSQSPGAVRLPPPTLGQDSRPVLAELGLSAAEIAELVDLGVVGP